MFPQTLTDHVHKQVKKVSNTMAVHTTPSSLLAPAAFHALLI